MRNFYLLVLVLFTMVSFAQPQYNTKSKKAIKYLKEGEKYFNSRQTDLATEAFNKAIKKDPNFRMPYAYLGQIYAEKKDWDNAIKNFEKVYSIDPYFSRAVNVDLAGLYFKTQKYNKCKSLITELQAKQRFTDKSTKKLNLWLASSNFSIKAKANPVRFKPENLGPNINSEFKDYLPVLSVDQKMLVFTRTIPDSRSPVGVQEDFYASYKKDGEWSGAINLGAPLNSEINEGGHALTPDGNYMFLTICERYGYYGKGRRGLGSCDLFVTKYGSNGWVNPRNMGPTINSNKHDAQPSMSSDGKTLYFSSVRSGGYGKSDLYMTERKNGKWTRPINLGDSINTFGEEDGVFIHPDNKTLFFTSNGHPGLGESDIFMSKRQPDGKWGKPVNLGYPINTSGDEWGLMIDALGKYAYFTSDRTGGYGDWDIYKFELPAHLKPTPVTYMSGLVYDAKTNTPLSAQFELIDLKTGEKTVVSRSNEKGQFLVCLPTGKDYALNVSKDGYLFYSKNFKLSGTNAANDPYHKDVPLNAITTTFKEGIVLENIFFDTDKFNLKPESEAELNKLKELLDKNPMLKIEIGGHTDNQGSKEHNKTLSENRAKSVQTWLIGKGIAADRLSYKGYGDEKPRATNDTEEGRAKNRRTEFKLVQ